MTDNKALEKATDPTRGPYFPFLRKLFAPKNEVDPKDVAKATASFAAKPVAKKRTSKPPVRTGPLANKRVPRKKY